MIQTTTSKINLNRIVFDNNSRSRVLDPTIMAGRHNVLTSMEEACGQLRRYSIPLEEGPYADEEGSAGRLCGSILRMSDGRMAFVEKTAEILTDSSLFSMNDYTVVSELPITAGSILSGESRGGHVSITLTHILEPYMLATSLLRRNGFECYPALAIIGHGEFEPVLAIMGIEDTPFAVLSLSEIPPPMHTLEIISDIAMLGVTHAMAAENTARLLAQRTIAMMQIEGDYPPEEEVQRLVGMMGDSLFECGMHWPGSPYIGRALDFLKSKMTQTYSLLAAASLRAHADDIPEHLMEDQIAMFSRGAFFLASGLEIMVRDQMEHRARLHMLSEVN
jgi:hypothetical protein